MLTKLRLPFVISIILLTHTSSIGKAQELSCIEILQHYKKSLSSLQSVSMHVVINIDSNDNDTFPQKTDFVFRQDKNRNEWIGKRLVTGRQGKFDLLVSKEIKEIINDKMYVGLRAAYLDKSHPDISFAELAYDYKDSQKKFIENPNRGGPLFGRMYGSNHNNLADLLGGASDLNISDKENINGEACFVLEGTSKYGKVKAWLAPEKGYNPIKWSIEKSPHHLFNDNLFSQTGKDWRVLFEVKEFHEIITEDGVEFVPKNAHFRHAITFPDGIKNIDHYEYITDDIQLNPDFDALGAFKVNLPDGTRIFNRDFQSVHFVWENGGPVAIVDENALDAIDQQIQQMNNASDTKSEEETKNTTVVPNKSTTIADTQPDVQTNIEETQPEVLSESRLSPFRVLILIFLFIIAFLTYKVFFRLRVEENKDAEI